MVVVWTFFSLVYHFSFLSPLLWDTLRYSLKYCLKGPLSPKQPTNYLIQLLKNVLRKCVAKCMDRKKNEEIQGRTNSTDFSIPRYNFSLSFCTPHVNFLSFMDVQMSLTKNVERKERNKYREE